MDTVLIILAGICLLVGWIGSFVSILPGVPLSYIGIVLLQLTDKVDFSWTFLLVWLVVVIVVQLLDSFLPIYYAQKKGGSKWAVWGSVIGCFIGFFFTPIGILLGTFLGAVVGELLSGKGMEVSLKAGLGTFVGFLLSIGLKLIVASILIYYYITALF
ncbi:MAG: DUF456 domain-containing protein [Paludibacteraceae bacterium]|jgi:uncharacterized protein YqgC (DUF456 family)|nr:DUF456 domain-containing protein [Paludibacteraceae bacterium]MDI9537219.1 DUF456 domain-containing protein [Bacteroidota bacterium]OQC34322.1 MAG: hypothetical protein BWX65_00451 [Bacteroidetes bacterium ADurb.Bin057]HHT61404.1 DUF456 domain-containing protein [Bacteroidales bacterium]MBP9039152.1 DUF456 domain-containing protein [Paludibacteraceae bacterium]